MSREIQNDETAGEDHSESLWYQIKIMLKPSEEPEIQRVIGVDVIENHRNLWSEVNSLHEILGELEQENDELQEKMRKRPGLPEHPERVMLKQQIRLILQKLQPNLYISEKGVAENVREKEIIDFVLDRDNQSQTMRPRSARSLSSRLGSRKGSRPLTGGSRPASARTINSAPDMLQHMKRHLSISKVDKIIRDLKITFEEEERELMAEIKELQDLIEEEMECKIMNEKGGTLGKSPTLTELKTYNKKLQEKWLHEDYVKETTSKLNKIEPFPPAHRPPVPPGSSLRFKKEDPELAEDVKRSEVNQNQNRSSTFSSRLRGTVQSSQDDKFLQDDDLKYLT